LSECKHGGNALDFIAKKEDISIHDAALRACEWFGVPLDDVKTTGSSDEPDAPTDKSPDANAVRAAKLAPAPAPESIAPNPSLKFRLDKLDRAHPYFTERGITEQTISYFGLGYFTGDKGLMVGRIAIPILNVKGEVVAYAGRWPGRSTGRHAEIQIAHRVQKKSGIVQPQPGHPGTRGQIAGNR
jgi:hypothetical protein